MPSMKEEEEQTQQHSEILDEKLNWYIVYAVDGNEILPFSFLQSVSFAKLQY